MIKSALSTIKGLHRWLILSPSLFLVFLISCGSEDSKEKTQESTPTEQIAEPSEERAEHEQPVESEETTKDTIAEVLEEESTNSETKNDENVEDQEETTTSPETKEEQKDVLKESTNETVVTETVTEIIPEPETIEKPVEEVVVKEVFSHTKFDALLRKYVTSTGKVNYNGFKNSASFEEYLTLLSENEPSADWSRNKKLAYWINAYNAFTIKLILDNYPVSSITKLHGGKPWDYKFIKIGSKTYSLNHIEHKIIRPVFKEPRIHFACVCAAKSCPKLANKAYTAGNINSLLTTQTKYFINNKSKNQIADKQLKVSSLFDWYAGDLGDINTYIAKYYNGTFKADKDIEFMEYDWSLNN